MNAYACSAYAESWRFHLTCLSIASSSIEKAIQGHRESKLVGEMHAALDEDIRRIAEEINQSDDEDMGEGNVQMKEALILKSRSLDGLGRVARESGNYSLAWKLHAAAYEAASRSLKLLEKDGSCRVRPAPHVCIANAISNAGVVAYRLKRHQDARRLHEAAKDFREIYGDQRGLSSSLGNLALLHDTPEEALPLYYESLQLRKELGDVWGVAGSLRALAECHRRMKDIEKARELIAEAAGVFAEVHDTLGVAECLETLGIIISNEAIDSDDVEQKALSACLFGAAVGQRRRIGADEAVLTSIEMISDLHESYPRQWEAGITMDLDTCVAFVANNVDCRFAVLRGNLFMKQ